MSHESIKPLTTSKDSLSPALNYISTKIRLKVDGSCSNQDKLSYTHKTVINIFIVYEIRFWPFNRNFDFTLGNYLFRSVKLTKNVYFDKYIYYGYGIGFDVNRNPFSYFLLGDDIFPLNKWFIKPYPGRNLREKQKIYNYRLSRARRITENAFRILAGR